MSNQQQQQQYNTKPLPPHLRPSLAFPSSTVLTQSEYILQQQKLGKTNTTLRQYDTLHDNKTIDNNTVTQQNIKVNDINAESQLQASIPLPTRFKDASVYNQHHIASNEHPLYRTSNNMYGQRAPSQAELPTQYFANQHKFTNTFAGGPVQYARLAH